jgi:hypothetical protein
VKPDLTNPLAPMIDAIAVASVADAVFIGEDPAP